MKLLLKLKEFRNNKKRISPIFTPLHIIKYVILHAGFLFSKIILFFTCCFL